MSKKKRPVEEFLLKLINSIFIISSLGIVLYGLYCLVEWKQALTQSPHPGAHPVLLASDLSKWLSDNLPTPWFIYLLLGIGTTLLVVSLLGYIGTATRSPCCLCSYSVLLAVFVKIQLAVAALMLFHHGWKEDIPKDKSGSFNSTYLYLKANWKIIRWVALAALILEVIAIVLALYLRSVNRAKRGRYDKSDDESIVYAPPVRRIVARKMNPPAGSAASSTSGKEQIKPITKQ